MSWSKFPYERQMKRGVKRPDNEDTVDSGETMRNDKQSLFASRLVNQ